VDQVENMRVTAGLKPLSKTGPEGWGYVPRQVEGIRGVELRRPSNAALQRIYDDAVEGYANGIRYDANPRATLELHTRAAYREVAEKQLSDAIEPLSLGPKELVPPRIRQRMEVAITGRQAAERARRQLVIGQPLQKTDPAAVSSLRKATKAQRQAADARVASASVEYQAAKAQYGKAMESARKAEVAPGSLFGKTDETIAVSQ